MTARPGVRLTALAGVVGVLWYIASWLVAGLLIDGFDALRQSISATFATGMPVVAVRLMQVALVATGLLLVAFAVALARGLPGSGPGAPAAMAVSGLATAVLPAFPCRVVAGMVGCDAAHVVVAAVAYLALIATPLLVARRVAGHAPHLAGWSALLGTLALVGFAVRYLGIVEPLGGLQQRVFNTIADAWVVLAGMWLARRN